MQETMQHYNSLVVCPGCQGSIYTDFGGILKSKKTAVRCRKFYDSCLVTYHGDVEPTYQCLYVSWDYAKEAAWRKIDDKRPLKK